MSAIFTIIFSRHFSGKIEDLEVRPLSVKVRCPHCNFLSSMEVKYGLSFKKGEFNFIGYCFNTECHQTLFVKTAYSYPDLNLNEIFDEKFIPLSPNIQVKEDTAKIYIEGMITEIYPEKEPDKITISDDIPEKYRQDYSEALEVLTISPNATALLVRRVLQKVIRDEFVKRNVLDEFFESLVKDKTKVERKSNLYQELNYFINVLDIIDPGLKKQINNNLDLIRKLGNIGAHPGYDSEENDSENYVDVNYEEAKFIIKLLDRFFDLLFVQNAEYERIAKAIKDKSKSI